VRVALLTTDSRDHYKDYDTPMPYFGTAPEALLQGFRRIPDVQLHVISCLQQKVSSPDKIGPNIWYHGLHVPRFGWTKTCYQGCIRAVRRKLRELQPQIVHGQGTERDCAVSAVLSGYPNVVTIHGNMARLAQLLRREVAFYGWLAARLEDFTLRRTAGVFCNSLYTEALVKPRAKMTWRVPNPIREEFLHSPLKSPTSRVPVILNVGLISSRKRQVELLKMAETLARNGFQFELRFIGLAPQGEYTSEFFKAMEIAERAGYARYLGLLGLKDLLANFDEAHALIHFPFEEAFGLVIAEALARNLKLFAAREGGIVEIADGAPGAELLDPEDWQGLENAIRAWVKTSHGRIAGGQTLMQSRYDPRLIAERHCEIYRTVLATRS
jgi:glycosyltransferase involved in cell wall biosynthesis